MNDTAPPISFGRSQTGSRRRTVVEVASLSVLGRIAYFGALMAIVVFAIPHGTFEPWLKGALVVAISLLGLFRVADGLFAGNYRIAEPRLLLPMAGIVLLAVIQLIPWLSGSPLTMDSYQTESFIPVFGALLVFAELLFFYVRNNRRLRQLVAVILFVAIASAVLGVLRKLVAGSSLDIFATDLQNEQSYAQFINRNHFSLLIEMGLGLLVGLLLKAQLKAGVVVVGCLLGSFLVYSMIVANSRGGLLSLSGMAFFTVFVFVMTRSPRANRQDANRRARKPEGSSLLTKIVTVLGLCLISFFIIVALVAFIGGDPVVTRLEVLDREFTSEQSRVNRALIWESTIEMVKERPFLGSGFGAYATAITKFDPTNGRFYLQQAHSDYLEILANGGLVAAILFAVFGVLTGSRMITNLRSSDRFRQACCFGALIGIFGVMIHSFLDFGLHVMVNALVFIALIVIGTAKIDLEVERR